MARLPTIPVISYLKTSPTTKSLLISTSNNNFRKGFQRGKANPLSQSFFRVIPCTKIKGYGVYKTSRQMAFKSKAIAIYKPLVLESKNKGGKSVTIGTGGGGTTTPIKKQQTIGQLY